MEQRTNNAGQLLGALVLGAAVGGMLGILFAPAKGSETRKKLSNKKDDLTNEMKEKFNNFLDEIKLEAESLTDRASAMMQDGTAKLEHAKMK